MAWWSLTNQASSGFHQYPEPPLNACCALKAGEPARLPAEYVLLALAKSNATFCSSPEHAAKNKGKQSAKERDIAKQRWNMPFWMDVP